MTITIDNDKEFAEHYKINEELNCKRYFCHPYRSWERGSNENANGYSGSIFEREFALSVVPAKRIQEVE